ncbi:Non-reducing end beta-L-arabinofuranosidase [Grifola frondosa]|uniref:Non-reducing end beta-L-arabinofuranosidase n=1 Tax=Grifola frondosa TaxID=5627 RepID=A0A1C7MNF5_GRIFR|nr:Non-reducing end beta-L-arabinofuranosidase [Grifola frondosa]
MQDKVLFANCFGISPADVKITSDFWAERLKATRNGSIPAIHEQMKQTGRWDCLKLKWKPGDPNPPDSDVAKWLEAACYFLIQAPDPELARLVEEAVDNIRGAQQKDGYINTYYTVVEPGKRWTNISWSHELYDAGHLLEAALAHQQYSHSTRLLDPMLKYVQYIRSIFGLQEGQKAGYPGHQELELALLKTYEHTKDASLVELANYFIDERGQSRLEGHYFDIEANARGEKANPGPAPKDAPRFSYHQANCPIREMKSIEGHSVRAMYWLTAVANLARISKDHSLLAAARRLWDSTTKRKMYVTGGLGAMPDWEGFGPDYFLPNETGYLETCAAIGLALFAHQMLLIDTGNGEYANALELVLHNAILVGVSLDGKSFFYDNPLASVGQHLQRSTWFEVSCCPANVARLFGSLGKYIYTLDANDTVYVNLYISSEVDLALSDGKRVRIVQKSNGPWRGGSQLTLEGEGKRQVKLRLRKPLGAKSFQVYALEKLNRARLANWIFSKVYVSGRLVHATEIGILAELQEIDGVVHVDFTYRARLIYPHPLDFDNRGCVAIARGPFVYCAETVDNPSIADLRTVRLSADSLARLRESVETESFREWGVEPVIIEVNSSLGGSTRGGKGSKDICLRLIPIFLWANRGKSDLRVWLPIESA